MTEPDVAPSHPPSAGPIFNSPPVVMATLAGLIAVHLARVLAGEDWYVWSQVVFAFIPAQLTGGWAGSLPGAQWWSFLSYAAIHGDWLHLTFNALWMLIFGTVLARYLGAARFLALSALAAIGGALATLITHWGELVFVVGASAAVSGQMAAAVPIMYARGLRPRIFAAPDLAGVRALSPSKLFASRPALIFLLMWLAITLLSGATGLAGPGDVRQIAWEAHLGGFVSGLLAFYLIDRRWRS